jgi:hypothetical protein
MVYSDHHRRDVVAGLALERQRHEPVGDLLGWISPRKDASHRALGYSAVQSVGTQQQAVARPDA